MHPIHPVHQIYFLALLLNRLWRKQRGTKTEFWQSVIFKIKYQFFGMPVEYTHKVDFVEKNLYREFLDQTIVKYTLFSEC